LQFLEIGGGFGLQLFRANGERFELSEHTR
jgi:hypothetical protein